MIDCAKQQALVEQATAARERFEEALFAYEKIEKPTLIVGRRIDQDELLSDVNRVMRALGVKVPYASATVALEAFKAETGKDFDTSDYEEVTTLRCPGCGNVLGDEDVSTDEVGWECRPGVLDFEATEWTGGEGEGDMETMGHITDCCQTPVTLPEGWTISWW